MDPSNVSRDENGYRELNLHLNDFAIWMSRKLVHCSENKLRLLELKPRENNEKRDNERNGKGSRGHSVSFEL